MNVDRILTAFNEHQVRYLLIGGMNFLLRHEPVLTYDIDLWIEDTTENCSRCANALAWLGAEWGASDLDWGPVAEKPAGWLGSQAVYCLTCPDGAIDIFLSVLGLAAWSDSFSRSLKEATAAGVSYRGLSDEDMMACQLALSENERKSGRVALLRKVIERRSSGE